VEGRGGKEKRRDLFELEGFFQQKLF